MRFVVCDDDRIISSMIETVVASHGHEVVGIADSTTDATALILAARPDVVILDMSLGYNTDFDMIATAENVGAKTIVFSYNGDARELSRYTSQPVLVPKLDFAALQEAIDAAAAAGAPPADAVTEDRRLQPTRVAGGRNPVGVTDAEAFYEALNGAEEG